ncbi:DUF5615 family PIN-like protein [Rhizobium leguminosarum]|uniref:DUF5615 family PIN-like protein n=1 Tax=Rhizobium leguminosarum TaxID=384 RepID=UPI000369DCEF|nr:DUF5615 family PIN-like protein [Rhizobium leguminosarum]MBY5368783.1 DUF5615 family PIN-like protein [Rhizobium leguminosarum]MBY5451777.1 DUF5615 family PIN-like protein [Rhizobium leguminosarum]
MRFLLDAGVPVSVGKVLQSAAHEVIYYHEVLAEKAADILVAEIAIKNDAILVAIDKDMRKIGDRYGRHPRLAKLDLLQLCCSEVSAAKRVDHALDLIESEWNFKMKKLPRRFWFEVNSQYLKTLR